MESFKQDGEDFIGEKMMQFQKITFDKQCVFLVRGVCWSKKNVDVYFDRVNISSRVVVF